MAAPAIPMKLDTFPAAADDSSSACLSDEEVLAFANGSLAPSRRPQAHAHLDECEICQRLLSEAAHALATAVTTPVIEGGQLSWHTTFQPGTLVGGRYLIRQFIARGGMGEVYEAFDRELQERVALKTVTSTACDNASAVRRLKAEVQLARRVSHPNVCRIYDFGTHVMHETGTQISFLTMEFVNGETLGQRVRSTGALPIEEARAFGRQLLRGLAAAHEAGILHRDFKSDNVMLRVEPGGGCSPLILDFGLARALDASSRSNSGSQSNLLGTFAYIAPEQLEGRPHTTASDVYSFGLVWFEMLTGVLPFDSPSSPVSRALARLQSSAVAPSSKNRLVPGDLDAVVLGCLRRSPKDRYQTAREVLNALDAQETRVRGASIKRRLLPWGIGAIIGGIGAYAALVSQEPPPRGLVVVKQASLAAPAAPNDTEPSPAAAPAQSGEVELASEAPQQPPAELLPVTEARVPKPLKMQTTSASPVLTAAGSHPAPSSAPLRRPSLPANVAAVPTGAEALSPDPPTTKPTPPWENPFEPRAPSEHPGGGGS